MKVQLEIICRGTVTMKIPDDKLEAVEALGSYCDLDDFEAASGVFVDLEDINITEHAEVEQIDILQEKDDTTSNESMTSSQSRAVPKKPYPATNDEG